MKFILFLLLSVMLANCTITTAQTTKTEPVEYGCCLTAAPVCAPILASNISETPRTLAAFFDGYEVYMGKDWNTVMLFEEDDMIYSGPRDHYMLNDTTKVIEAGIWTITINLESGTGNLSGPGKNIELRRPTYSGAVARSN